MRRLQRRELATVRGALLLGTVASVVAPPTAAAAPRASGTPRPVPLLVSLRLDYGGIPRGLGPGGTFVPLSPAVVGAALRDNTYLRYERHADLGGFEPAPIGQVAAIVTARALGGAPRRTEIPLYARSQAAGNQVSSFAFVPGTGGPGSAPTGTTGTSGVPPSSGSGTSGGPSGTSGTSPGGTSGSLPPASSSTTTLPESSTTTSLGGSTGRPATTTSAPTPGSSTSTTTIAASPGGASGGGHQPPPTTNETTTTQPRHGSTTTSSPTTSTAVSSTTTSTTTTTIPATTTTSRRTTTTSGGTTTTTLAGASIAMTNSRNALDVVSATNMAPGSSVTRDVTIGNAGTTSFVLSLRSSTTSTNLLAHLLQLSIVRLSSPTRTVESGGLAGSASNIETMSPGETTTFAVTLSLPATAGNDVQSQTAIVDLVWSGQA